MRNRYPCRCLKCKKTMPRDSGDYIGWLEGTRDADGMRRQSGQYGVCDACKAAEKSEPPAGER